MLDLKLIRENEKAVREAIENKGEKADLDRLLDLDEKRRILLQQADELKHERNVVSEKIARMKKEKKDAGQQIADMRKVSDTTHGCLTLPDAVARLLRRTRKAL